jgi:hypothetical protein
MVVETFEASYIGDLERNTFHGTFLPEKGPLSFHSVFSSTLNLSSAGTIFTLQKPSVFLTPLSIAVKVSENFNFRDFFTPGFNYRIEKKSSTFVPG